MDAWEKVEGAPPSEAAPGVLDRLLKIFFIVAVVSGEWRLWQHTEERNLQNKSSGVVSGLLNASSPQRPARARRSQSLRERSFRTTHASV